MGFADFARDSFKRNRELRKRQEPYDKMKKNYFLTPQPVTFKKASPKKVKEITQRYLKQKRKERIIGIILLVLCTLLVGWFFIDVLTARFMN